MSRRPFKVGDMVRFRETLTSGEHTWHPQMFGGDAAALRPGDVGVVREVRHNSNSIPENKWAYRVTFARVGDVKQAWGASRLDLVSPVEDTPRG